MSDHADTIRRVITNDDAHFDPFHAGEALRALDALLAERQQAQEERDAARKGTEKELASTNRELLERLNVEVAALNQVLGERRQAIDALRRIKENAESWHGTTPPGGTGHSRALAVIAEWCDAALEAVGEQPS